MERFVNKVAVVTGAAQGLGKAISKELLKRGLIVVGIDRNGPELQKLVAELSVNSNSFYGKFHGVECNITKEKDIKDTFQKIDACIGPIWILVNNAGTATDSRLPDVHAEDFDVVFDTNVRGLLLCTQEVLKLMKNHQIDGHIININSVTSLTNFDSLAMVGCTPYPASKHAARAVSEGLRQEIKNRMLKVKVSDISPGLMDTPLSSATVQMMDEKTLHVLQPEDVAHACITVLDTPPNVLITELTIRPIYY